MGVAIVLHDLGLAVAAYPGGRDELRKSPGWADARAAAVRRRLGRAPTEDELSMKDPDLDSTADATILRRRHAEHASELVNASWAGQKLVVNPDLRIELGSTAGRIAASHWWPVEKLASLGDLEGAPGGMPSSWTIRPILLAVLLRTADAAHLDASRAPRFAHAIHRPLGEAKNHWEFQARLRQPVLIGDQLQFVSNRAFPASKADSWWLCLDHLRTLNEELGAIDSLLQAHALPRLSAQSVRGARDPLELAQVVRPDGWEPVDARVEVSDVGRLVQRLGGKALYGINEAVPIRELLQNASDAVLARKSLQDGFQGIIDVHVSTDLDEITVADNGVGMGLEVLTGALLDFGRSLWESEELASVLPGLQAAGFQPTGRFGIGFFSVFMWANKVEVISRPWRGGEEETRVLSFGLGARHRPLLRAAASNERLMQPGTVVRLRGPDVEDSVREWLGVSRSSEESKDSAGSSLAERLGQLAPAFPVDLRSAFGSEDPVEVLQAEDWITISGEELLERIRGKRTWGRPGAAAGRMDFVGSASSPAGRAALEHRYDSSGVLVAGGLRVGNAPGIAGVLWVDDVDASRSHGIPTANREDVANWASTQAGRIGVLATAESGEVAGMILALGGDPGELVFADSAVGPLNRRGLKEWAAERDIVQIVDAMDAAIDARDVQAIPPEPVITLTNDALDVRSRIKPTPEGMIGPERRSIESEIFRLVADAWGCDIADIERWETEREDLFDVQETAPVWCIATELIRPGSPASLERSTLDL